MQNSFPRTGGHSGRGGKRKTFRNLLVAAVFLAVVAWWFQEQNYQNLLNTPVDSTSTQTVSLVIKQGEGATQTAKSLKEKELIRDETIFTRYLKQSGLDRKLVAGRFQLSKAMTTREIAEAVTNAQKSQAVVTVPEGFTITQIDARLAELELITAGDFAQTTRDFGKENTADKNSANYQAYPFLDAQAIQDLPYPLEGYLFPDTYFVDSGNFQSEDLIQLMLKNFATKTASLRQALETTPVREKTRSLHELVTMASILQHEVHTSKDLPIVSGILWKRLDSGWMLGADATLLYLKDDRTIDYFDLQEESPYNTRNRQGLPPGPIGSPGLKHIEAALAPQESPFWFYLTTLDTGEVIYGATTEEHTANKAKYL